jgi:ArsR family transcriptional regulator, lead/cadmium/zinc/bismuth-responsive transcriptional repressor
MNKKQENTETICGVIAIDEEKVKAVSKLMPDEEKIDKTAETFKILGDPTRLKIVLALIKEELCVCDISALIGVSVSAISHQLRLLRGMRLVKHHKDGKMVYYSIDDEHIENIISETLVHINEF